jgi:signal transduction histidine kinase
MADEFPGSTDEEFNRREAMGAFSHEIRTPLTSIRMVLELAKREATGDSLVLDAELAQMLHTSVDDLQALADDLQEASRIERGRTAFSRGPCDLLAAYEAAAEMVQPKVQLEGPLPPSIDGPWDAGRLVRALAGFAESANRVGDGSGVVRVGSDVADSRAVITMSSGEPGGKLKPIAADVSFGFFRSRMFVLAMGGDVSWDRRERYFSVRVDLPRE